MTAAQFIQQQTEMLSRLESDTEPLQIASNNSKVAMLIRIFSKGENQAGQSLLSVKGYDTTPLYISKEIVGGVGTFVGKKGNVVKNKSASTINAGARNKEIKSAYFPGGYKELKSKLGKGILELTGRMQSDIANGFINIVSATRATLGFKDPDNAEKMIGNETGNRYWKGRGIILAPTDAEADIFVNSYTDELLKRGYL
jgi:hypothetical protein